MGQASTIDVLSHMLTSWSEYFIAASNIKDTITPINKYSNIPISYIRIKCGGLSVKSLF